MLMDVNYHVIGTCNTILYSPLNKFTDYDSIILVVVPT